MSCLPCEQQARLARIRQPRPLSLGRLAGLSGQDVRGLGRIIWNPNVVEAPISAWIAANEDRAPEGSPEPDVLWVLREELAARGDVLLRVAYQFDGTSRIALIGEAGEVLAEDTLALEDRLFPPSGADAGYKTWGVIVGGLALVSAGASAYHGYKRNGGSIGWGLGWGALGLLFPILTPSVALAQGYGKRQR